MSVQSDIAAFLTTLAKGATGQQVDITPDVIALQTGQSRDKVNKTLNNLMTRKRLELVRGPNGRAIIGYKLLEPPPDRRRRAGARASVPYEVVAADEKAKAAMQNGAPKGTATVSRPVRNRQPYTPNLDRYEAAKKRFAVLTEELGDRVEATFREDPLAEEALLIRERVTLLEDQLHEWRQRASEAERERDGLRTRHMEATTKKALESGAMVQHSTD